LLLISVLPACTVFHGSATDNPTVDLKLNWDGKSCKAAVQDLIYVSEDGARITWNVTDNCNQTENENETQFVFKYQSQPAWLEAEEAVARTNKNGTAKIKYKAKKLGQPDKAEAKYSIFYGGDLIADPKVVWGRP
jgi:hypothetical protein